MQKFSSFKVKQAFFIWKRCQVLHLFLPVRYDKTFESAHRLAFCTLSFFPRQKCHKIRYFWLQQSNGGNSGGTELFSDVTADDKLLSAQTELRNTLNRKMVWEQVSKCVITEKKHLLLHLLPSVCSLMPSLPIRVSFNSFPKVLLRALPSGRCDPPLPPPGEI